MLHYMKNHTLFDKLSDYIIGHDEAKKALVNLLNRSSMRHFQIFEKQMHADFLLEPHKLLLIGASGTGKTFLVESLKSIIDFPLIRVDATKFNHTGAMGGIKEEELRGMIMSKAKKLVKEKPFLYPSVEGTLERMVVFIDEIDKIASKHDATSRGSWNTQTQHNFLTLFDHKTTYSGVSFVFAGAFTGLREKFVSKNNIGFAGGTCTGSQVPDIEELLLDYGIIPELIGRLTNIVELDEFKESDYRKILIEKIIPKKQMDLAQYGIFNIDLNEETKTKIIKSAIKSGQGVRYLKRQVDKIFLDLEFNYEEGLDTRCLGLVEDIDTNLANFED